MGITGETGVQYNDTTAYLAWFNKEVENDPHSQASPVLIEELKFRSFFFAFGRRFLKHKKIHPYISLGAGVRTTIGKYSRKYFEIDDSEFGNSVRQDLSAVSEAMPGFSTTALGFRARAGIEFFRYHLGLTADYSLNLTTNAADETTILEYKNIGAGFGSLSLSIGADLFTADLNSKSKVKDIYEEEYTSLSSSLQNDRRFSLGVTLRSPIYSSIKAVDPFTIIEMEDLLDTASAVPNFHWESLRFGDIDRFRWSPKFELDFRLNLGKRLAAEFQFGWSTLTFDHTVEFMNSDIIWNTSNSEYEYDSLTTSVNMAVYRRKFVSFQPGLAIYFTMVDKPMIDLRMFAGINGSWFASVSNGVPPQKGINGTGDNIFREYENYIQSFSLEPYDGNLWRSDYVEDANLSVSPSQMMANHQVGTNPPLTSDSYFGEFLYGTVNAGLEVEFNRFLVGIAGDFSITQVNEDHIQNYFNLNLSLGYLLFSKYKQK